MDYIADLKALYGWGVIGLVVVYGAIFLATAGAATVKGISKYLSSRPSITKEHVPDRNGDDIEDTAIKVNGRIERFDLSYREDTWPGDSRIVYLPEDFFEKR